MNDKQERERAMAHWQDALGGSAARFELATDRPRAGRPAGGIGEFRERIDAATVDALAAKADCEGHRVSEMLFATWTACLARLSGQDDVLVGLADAADGDAVLPVQVDFDGAWTPAQLLAHVAGRIGDARLVGGIDAAGMAALVGRVHGEAAEPLFRAVFEWQDGGDIESGAQPAVPADVAIAVGPGGEPGLEVRVRFADALFDAATMRRYVGHWLTLLRGVALAGDATLMAAITLLDDAQRHQVLEAFNATQADFPADSCIHELVEAQMARTPDAVAVKSEAGVLTYAQLNARANQLAHHLRGLGVGPDDRVAICIERGLEMVVGLLAILKAGGAYVPLDPSYPADRLRYMLEDCAPVALLTQASLEPVWSPAVEQADLALPVLDLQDAQAWRDAPTGNIDRAGIGLAPDNLAYVIYTSGSTGMPKGVMNEHRGVVNRLWWMQAAYRLDADDAVLQKTPFGFDVSVWEFFWPLQVGARLVMAREQGHKEPAYLAGLIRSEKITTLHFVPSMLHTFLEDDAARGCTGLVRTICSGEALPAALVERFNQVLPGVELHNLYGPTEAAVDVTAWACPQTPAMTTVPIGSPIANTRIYVLDALGEPVPVGVAGEIHIGGVQVARGYLNRDQLTVERFVPDPFVGGAARMYRTGDLGRWLPDGNIEYLGRNDFQVKIRGFRIELGEIEARLVAHPGVREAVVVAREDSPGNKRIVAYYVAADDVDDVDGAGAPRTNALRDFLLEGLPDYMVPAAFVRMQALPLTSSGKRDRKALPAPGRERPDLANDYEPALGDAEGAICAAFAQLLDLVRIGRHDNFFELGGNSLLAARLLEALKQGVLDDDRTAAARAAGVLVVFRNPTPAALASALASEAPADIDARRFARSQRAGQGERPDYDPVAIIAVAGRFPGAADVETFWRNVRDGLDTITFFGTDGLDPSIGAAERADPDYVPARGIIDDVEQFDAAFFGVSPREAELMDPQHRIFLELCWECMERAGHVPGETDGPVGVFAGTNNGTYMQRHVSAHPELVQKLGAFQVMVANEKDYISTRVAHKLDLTGPAISIHTACSTSLVAICQAVDSLRAGQCDMALAGAASVTCPPRSGYSYQEGGMLSPDGHTRAFDAAAQGTVFGDGAAVLLLKRLSDALADGDQVYALIRGGAINNDGGRKASFTAPSSDGQAAVIAMAHRNARVDPRSISYVEAHGTGTPLGDPIEIEGLTKAFRRGTDDVGFCRVGSVKSNVGHLVAAAGAAGVIKAALSLRDRVIPGTAHFTEPNPAIAFEGSPFTVSAASVDWESDGAPRRAGVSSFGVGGTNAHVVMEQAPERAPSDAGEGPHLLPLSARTPHALGQVAARLASHLEQSPDTSLADVAWTLAAGRKAFAHRVAVVAANPAEAVEQLRSLETTARIARSKPARESDVVFLFPGQGSQYAGMGRELYRAEPVFREAFDACADAVAGLLPAGLRELVFGDDADALLPTGVMQPAIFAVEYATARLWMDQGLRPAAMIGHSIGEFVAATIAGVFEPAEAMRLVARRGALMQAQPAGGMLSVRLPLDEVVARLPGELSLAVENGAAACVVSGPHDAIARFRAALDADGVACRELKTSHAFHSAMMEPVVAPFRAEVEAIARSALALPIVSTATGDWLDDGQACSPDYWATHLRAPVRFASALARVIDTPARVVLEVGPRTTLTGLARQAIAAGKAQVAAVASLSDAPAGEVAALRLAAGQLWSQGAFAGIDRFDRRANRHRVRLPTYPFERQRYWVEAGASAAPAQAAAATVLSLPDACPAPIQAPAPENIMSVPAPVAVDRRPRLTAQLKEVFEDVAGFDLSDADEDANFIELGLDSLNLTQVALQLQKTFAVKVTFRQLMAEYSTLRQLAQLLDEQLPADAAVAAPVAAPAPAAANNALPTPFAGMALASLAPSAAVPPMAAGGQSLIQQVIQQQMQVMAQQLAVLSGQPAAAAPATAMPVPAVASVPPPVAASAPASVPAAVRQAPAAAAEEDTGALQIGYDVKKSFGAIARIHTSGSDLDPRQQEKLRALIDRYVARTPKSKAYTQEHRAHMADPRVVSGFRPLWKEIVYQTVVARSKGSRLWDIDGNEYIDASNGFGMSLFGWQPDFVLDAVREQLEQGYEIGPQHPLAGEVARLVCEMTGHDRAGLCNTGSEAVLGALRIARTVTGRNLVAVFGGSYHGINDEVVVRGNRKMRAIPGAPGILRNACEHVLVLDYGTPEALQAIREHAHELAAVLVEPVQSRRPDLQPVEFLREVRAITAEAGAVLIFDEVITGFRAHPGGAQALFGIKADLATYGKVIGGGYPLGVVAGKREYMDALDGGHWQYGDDSMPTVGVTYFAGTFVRHPLALAATKASLEHLKAAGPGMQERLNARTAAFADEVNAFLRDAGAPIEIRHFASLWRTHWLEEHPLQDLLYAMIRSRGVHILDNFPCYFTTAHSEADIQAIAQAYKDSVTEMLEAEFLPRSAATPRTVMDPARPPVSGARLGREPDGRPAWFVPDQARPGKYLKVAG